jgi:arginine/lysine/ornithine decarboxylase
VKTLGEGSMIAAVMSVVRPGERLVIARNAHKSAFAGLVRSGARPIYVGRCPSRGPAQDP